MSTKNMSEYKAFKREQYEKLEQLETDIAKANEELNTLKERYNKAIIDEQDSKADKLYPKIDEQEAKIKRLEYRLNSSKGLISEKVKNEAYSTFMAFNERASEIQAQLDELDSEMKPLAQKQATLFEQANALKQQYDNERRAYEHLKFAEDLTIQELNKRGHRGLSRVEAFKESKALLPTVQGTQPKQAKKEPIPKNATLKERAEASRLTK